MIIQIVVSLFIIFPKNTKYIESFFLNNEEINFKTNSKNYVINNQAIPLQNIQYLQNTSNTFLISSQVTNTYEGIIVSIKENTLSNKNSKIILTLKDFHGGLFSFAYSENDLKNLKIIDSKTDTALPEITDLYTNDRVKITETIDLKKFFGNNRILVTIQKK